MDQILFFITEKSKLLLIAGVFFVLLEFLRPARRQGKWRKDSGLDLIYAFAVPFLVYPATILLNAWLIGTFFPPSVNPGETGQQAISQLPEHGQAKIHPDGQVTYHPDSGFLGLDHFTATTKYDQNTVTRIFLVKVSPASGVSSKNESPAVYIREVDKQFSGKVTEGISGFFFHMRQAIYEWNLGLQLLLATFLLDFLGYWRHRLMHTRFLWPFHAIHHSPKELDWLSNERFHPVNVCITNLLGMTVLILLFGDPFVVTLSLSIRGAYGMFIHSNVKISYGPLDTIFASPLFHHWHHAANEMTEKNYCTFFSFLDRVFGTYYLPKDKKEPASTGLAEDDMANRFWPQIVYPFIKLARMKAR